MNQPCKVKLLDDGLVISKLQGGQGKKLLYHLVHFSGLIHDHLAVIITTLRVLCHAFCKALRISLNQCNRRLKLMGYIGNKIPACLVNPYLFLNVLLKLIIGCF